MRLTRSALSLVGLLALPAGALAQEPAPARSSPVAPQDVALAQSLFDDARRLMIASDFAAACPKLAESQRLDPALGTLLNLAVCNERLGMTASAWGEYRDAESVAKREGRGERETYAHVHAVELEPRLSRLVIARARGNADRGLVVLLDGVAVGEPAFGSAVPIDPGTHRIEARAPGKVPWASSVAIEDHADRKAVEIPALASAPLPAAPAPIASPGPEEGPLAITLPSVSATQGESGESGEGVANGKGGRRLAAYVVGGVALASLAVGAVAGMQAIVQWDDRNKLCSGNACSQAGLDADGAARGWAIAADVGLGIGAVGAAGAAFLFFTSRSAGAPGETREVGLAGLRVLPSTVGGGARTPGIAIDGVW